MEKFRLPGTYFEQKIPKQRPMFKYGDKIMTRSIWAVLFGWLLLFVTGCFRNEISQLTVHVPAMSTEQDARIVTNAALNEVVGCLESLKHDYEFDLEKGMVTYHGSRKLMSEIYRSNLTTSLGAIGLKANIVRVGFNPLRALRMPDGSVINDWPDRYTALLAVPEMDTVTEANRVADAIAFVRNGGNDPRVAPDPERGTLDIHFNNVALSERNITEAIACAGYSANGTPPQEVPQGWNALEFSP